MAFKKESKTGLQSNVPIDFAKNIDDAWDSVKVVALNLLHKLCDPVKHFIILIVNFIF